MFHFLCYIIKYGLGAYPASRDDVTDDFPGWQAYQWIFPPAICFSWNGKDGGQLNATTGNILMDDEYNPLPVKCWRAFMAPLPLRSLPFWSS